MKQIYIILSYSGTVPSMFIRAFTRFKYAHVSLSFDKNMNKMYSFGRKKLNNPLYAGMVIEDKNGLFYQKFSETECVIYEIDINKKKYKKLRKMVDKYENNIDYYYYDMVGLVFKLFKIKLRRKHHFVCTDFVSTLLIESNIHNFNKRIIEPKHFLEIPNKKLIYSGKLLNY